MLKVEFHYAQKSPPTLYSLHRCEREEKKNSIRINQENVQHNDDDDDDDDAREEYDDLMMLRCYDLYDDLTL